MHRATASVLHGRAIGSQRHLATAFVWGANRHDGEHRWESSLLAEANLALDARNTVFSRIEHVRKTNADLALDDDATSATDHSVTGVSLGYVREVGTAGPLGFGIGARGSITLVPESLRSVYGSAAPTGLVVVLRMRAKPMTSAELAEMHERMHHAAMGMKM